MLCSTLRHLAVITVYFCCSLSAQTKSDATHSSPTQSAVVAPTKSKPPKKKLTPQQRQGIRLLKGAEASAAGLEPAMQTYVLWQVSHGYRTVDRAKAETVLLRAFSASRAIEDEAASQDCPLEPACHVQRWLQTQILQEILRPASEKSDPERAEKLLPEANVEVKKRLLGWLASEYIRKENFDHARQLMNQMDDDDYSYYLAGELMAALPVSRREERLAIFAEAFRNYQNRNLESVATDDEKDFGVLVVRFWREVPSMAMDAVDSILARSKDRDDITKAHSVSINLMNGKSLAFESEYEYRVFQLLPILQELDPSRAESLLAEHERARSALDQYPQGMQSIDPNSYGDKPRDENTLPGVLFVTGAVDDDPAKNNEYQATARIVAQTLAQLQRVTEQIKDDPEGAYQSAINLPIQPPGYHSASPRAVGLRRVAFALIKKNPTLAKAAMNEARRLTQDAEPSKQAMFMGEIPDFYLKLGDEDGARSAIKDQVKIAEKLYAIDTDAGDPNVAFKGGWPSSTAWQTSIKQATKVSPALAEEIVAQISDPGIANFEQVIYANALLRAEESSVAVIEWHKSGKRGAAPVLTNDF